MRNGEAATEGSPNQQDRQQEVRHSLFGPVQTSRRTRVGRWAPAIVLARLRPQWAILSVVLTVCLLAATLLSGLAVLVDASQRFGVRATLAHATPDETRVDITADLNGMPLAPAHRALDRSVTGLLGGLPSSNTTHLVSTVAAVTEPAPLDRSGYGWLTYYADYDGLAGTTTLLRGVWPRTAGSTTAVPVAIPERLAKDLGLELGDRFDAADQMGSTNTRAVVVGVYRVATRPVAAVWSDDPLEGKTFDPAHPVPYTPQLTATAYGPLVTSREAFLAGSVPTNTLHRVDVPRLADLPLSRLHQAAQRAKDAHEQIPADLSSVTRSVLAITTLGTTLERAERYLVVTRSSITVTALLLLVLSLSALLLAARLLADRRLTEQSLMRARGASGRQVVALAAVEATFLAVVVALAAPQLARLLYLVLARNHDFEAAGMHHDPGLPPIAWLTSGAACLLFVLVLLAPLVRRGGTFVEQEQQHARQDRRTVIQRSGLDVAVVALAVLAYWQLRSYRSPLVGDAGTLAIDPVLVAGPALALLGGALITVRLVPAVSRVLELVAARGRAVVLPLAAWEVGRRSRRAVGAVLLLSLALAVGTFGLSFLSTWAASQQDQADFQAPADVVVRTDPQLPALERAQELAAVSGAGTLLPVVHTESSLGDPDDQRFLFDPNEDGTPVQLLAVDTHRVSGLLHGRVIAPGGASAAAMGALTRLGPGLPTGGVRLPGTPTSLSARVRLELAPTPPTPMVAAVRFVVQDATGARQIVPMGEVPVDGRTHPLSASLVDPGKDVTGPLRVVAVQTLWIPSPADHESGEFDSGSLFGARVHIDSVVTHRAGSPDHRLTLSTPVTWHTSSLMGSSDGPVTGSGNTLVSAHVTVAIGILRFLTAANVVFTTWAPSVLPISGVANTALLQSMDVAVGDTVAVRGVDAAAPVQVDTVVPYLPGLDTTRPQLLVDLDALTRRLIEAGATTITVNEWWAQVAPDRAPAWANAVTASGVGTATSRVALGHQLQRAPLRVGLLGALWLIVVAAAAFAGVGFAMHTTVAVRLRRVEFSQLRALGITRRALNAVVGTENLLLGLLGVGCGVGLGALLALLVTPMVSLTADGSRPVPPVLVHIPWHQVGLLAGGVCAVLAVILLAVTQALRTSALGAVLRLGDER